MFENLLPETLLRPLVWTDFRLAVFLLVAMPLVLLLWSMLEKSDAIYRLLSIYWKVASLLMVTVYLMIAALPISFVAAVIARVLIPVSLWFWVDLNDDVADMPTWKPMRFLFSAWRWAVTVYCGLGVLLSGMFLRCGFISKLALEGTESRCSIWLAPPHLYQQTFHNGMGTGMLGFLAIVGLVAYVACLAYFVLVRLSKQGRMASRL
jgi:hypothetical protein